MAQKRRKSKDEVKGAAILTAATRLFLKQGFSNTSMDAIAAQARVTKQTVYAHYQSKDKLFTQMVSELCRQHTPPEALLKDKDKPIEELLYEIGKSFLDMITSREGLEATRLVIAEVHHHPKLAQQYYEGGTQRMVLMLVQFLNMQNERKKMAIPDTVSAASYFFSMLKGRYYVRMLLAVKPQPDTREKLEHVRETVRIFMRIYGGKQPMHTKDVL